jgi:hypothetical protein
MTDSKKELIRRIKAIIGDSGASEGEVAAAEAALDRIQRKYGISDADIDSVDKNWFVFKLSSDPDLRQIEGQVILNFLSVVLAMKENDLYESLSIIRSKPFGVWLSSEETPIWKILLTPAQSIELRARIEFFSAEFSAQKKVFVEAFVQRNNLGRASYDGTKEKKPDPKTEIAVARMSAGFDRSEFRTEINGKAEAIGFDANKKEKR